MDTQPNTQENAPEKAEKFKAQVPVILYPSKVLRDACEGFPEDLEAFVETMRDTMNARGGIGIAANQIGYTHRMFLISVGDFEEVCLNPQIVERRGKALSKEGCLSCPHLMADVQRAKEVVVKFQRPDGSEHTDILTGLAAYAFQHEMDHLRGKLIVDYLSPLKRDIYRRRMTKIRRRISRAVKEAAVRLA